NAMRELFTERPDLCRNTLDIADRCRFDLGIREVHFPDFPTPKGRSAGSVLAERCWRGLDQRGMKPTKEVRDRLDTELAQIQAMGFAAYFLNVADARWRSTSRRRPARAWGRAGSARRWRSPPSSTAST